MPTVVYTTTVREAHEGFVLCVKADHSLIAGEPSADAVHVKGRLLNIDIVSRGDVVLSFTGLSNGQPILTSTMARSTPLDHFHRYLTTNAHALGMSTVSDAYIDEDDDTVKVSLSPSNPYETELGYPRVVLTSMKLSFIYRSTDEEQFRAHDIFSERSFLPCTVALDNVVEKIVSFHLVRRYPLIFGSLRQKLHAERLYYPHISRNLSGILVRSSDLQFKHDASKLLRRLRKRLCKEAAHIGGVCERHLASDKKPEANLFEPENLEQSSEIDTLSSVLSRLMRSHVRAPRYKGFCAESLYATKNDPLNEFALNEAHSEPSLDKALVMKTQLRWDDLPTRPMAAVDGDSSQDSVFLHHDYDIISDSGGYWDPVSSSQDVLEADDDDDNDNYIRSDLGEDPSHYNALFDEDFDESNHLLDDACQGTRPSSPIASPESSLEDCLETPCESQVAYDPGDTLWIDNDPHDISFDATQFFNHHTCATPCCHDLIEPYSAEHLYPSNTLLFLDHSSSTTHPPDVLDDLLDDLPNEIDSCLAFEEDEVVDSLYGINDMYDS